MKTILFALSLVIAAAQQPSMPEPGNPGHVEPPPGMHCVHAAPGVSEAQACHCEPTCMEGRDGEGNPDGTLNRVEDAKCRAFCFKASCSCVSNCEP